MDADVAGGSASAFNFRGGHDFRSSTPPADPIESGDMWIHDAPNGTIDGVYTGISGQIANGQLVLWDGNSYVMISGTLPGYPDVGDGEGGTLDSRYLKLGVNAGAQTVASTDTTTFDGTVEAGGGVKVTGGSAADVSTGLFKPSGADNLRFTVAGKQGLSINESGRFTFTPADTTNVFDVTGEVEGGGGSNSTVFFYRPTITGTSTATVFVSSDTCTNNGLLNNVSHYYASSLTGAGGVSGFERLFVANSISSQGNNLIGFSSNIETAEDKNNYNFFATNTAPNFFGGDTHIGGTATRNTRELWESTLTEEQKEQLAAGTLAIPANVSTPGDGSFVRQWWYDQQSAEDQALIDAGELDYPERYQAANFVDTFELDVDTNINLLSNGRGEFSSGVKVTGNGC